MKNWIQKEVLSAKGIGSLILLALIGITTWGMQPARWDVWALQTLCWVAVVGIQKYAK